MTMSSRTLSQRDNVKRTRRFVSDFEKWGAWWRTPALGDTMNDDESLGSEYQDESLSSEQLEFSPQPDLSEWSSVLTAKSNSSSSREAGRMAVWRKNIITVMVDIICSSEYLRTNLVFRNTFRARKMAMYTDVIVKHLKEWLGIVAEIIFLSMWLKKLNARKLL